MDMIIKNLWIGGRRAAYNEDALISNGIKHILNMSAIIECKFPETFNYK